MVQFFIDMAHMIAAIALSLVGISYEPSGVSDEAEQAGLFQTRYAYVSNAPEDAQAESLAIVQIQAQAEMPHAVETTGTLIPISLRLNKLELELDTQGVTFRPSVARLSPPQPAESIDVIESDCIQKDVSVLRTTVAENI